MTVKRYTPTQCCKHDGTYVSYTDYQELENQLEAERQRADDLVLHVNTQANMREKAEAEIAALKAKLANPVVLRKVIEPDDVDSILDPTANPDEYAKCVGSDMWNAAMAFAVRSIHKSGFTVKGDL